MFIIPHPPPTSSPHCLITSSSHQLIIASSHELIISCSNHLSISSCCPPGIAANCPSGIAASCRSGSVPETYNVGVCRPGVVGDPSSFWSAALLTAGLLPCGPSDRPTVGHESHPGHAVWTLQCISMPLPHSRGRDGVQGCVAAGGLARIWAQSHLERPSC